VNKEQRKPYFRVVHEAEKAADSAHPEGWAFSLCHGCVYAFWTEDGPVCEHPIIDMATDAGDHAGEVWSGTDCWGFRPKGGLAGFRARLFDQIERIREDAWDDLWWDFIHEVRC
jgi:hypothetical protein